MKWYIKDIEIKNQVVMAPMAGVSNPTYMSICETMGVGFAITELISSEAIVRANKKTFEMLDGIDKLNIPVAIQIFGSNPKTMAKSAKILVDKYKVKIIDINMGCPVLKVAIKNGAGSALMKNPEKVREIVSGVVSAVDVPVTVKIRSGWDKDSINAVEIAKIVEEAGASAISVHARTRTQGYSGNADWSIIKDVVESVNIPVIGNGDIRSPYDAKKMLDETGCTAIMIGRALIGNPWIIKDTVNYLDKKIEPINISVNEKIDMMENHLNLLIKNKGEKQAVLEIRSHLLSYLNGMPNNKEIKNIICTLKNSNDIIEVLEKYRKENN